MGSAYIHLMVIRGMILQVQAMHASAGDERASRGIVYNDEEGGSGLKRVD